MLRFPHALRALAIGSVAATLAACSHMPLPSSLPTEKPPTKVPTNYDAYYGSPTQHQHGAARRDQTSQITDALQLRPNAPQKYVVKKGDTLWKIAKKFLVNPWYWPEIWDKNRNLANPHRLFPGDILYLSTENIQAGDGTTRLEPRIRVERLGNQGQPISVLANFLEWPRIMDETEIRNAPYLLESRDGHTLIAPGETLYARNVRAPIGQRLAVYHPDGPVLDPETKQVLGHQVKYGGVVRVERTNEVSTLTLLESFNQVRSGDRLLPIQKVHAELNAPIQYPPIKIRGQIAGLYEADYISADYMVIAINRGKQHGLKPGYTVGIYHDGMTVADPYQPRQGGMPQVQLPPEKVANAVIYSVGDKVSYALIMDSTREVSNGDKIGNP